MKSSIINRWCFFFIEKTAMIFYMKNVFHFQDNYYPFTFINHKRITVRAVLINEKNEVLLHHLVTDDDFGHRDCYELPGGGKKKHESFHQGVLREVKEETEYEGRVVTFLGKVIDYYNLIHRENHNYYYLVKITKNVGKNLEEYEKEIIKESLFVDIDTAINLMNNVDDDGVGHLVKQREIPILKLAKEYLNEHSIGK